MLVDQTAGVGMQVPAMFIGELAGVGRAVLCWSIKTTGYAGRYVCWSNSLGR